MRVDCAKCGEVLDGASPTYCKKCAREYTREWRKRNPERHKARAREYTRTWRKNNPERFLKSARDFNRKWRKNNPVTFRTAIRRNQRKLSDRDIKDIAFPVEKFCPTCRRVLPREGFSINRQRKDGLHHICRECRRKRS